MLTLSFHKSKGQLQSSYHFRFILEHEAGKIKIVPKLYLILKCEKEVYVVETQNDSSKKQMLRNLEMNGRICGRIAATIRCWLLTPHLAKHAVKLGKSLQNSFLPRRQFVDMSVTQDSFPKSLILSFFLIAHT